MYERWLSTPVIKYGASEGSQHARASAFKDGARTFPLASLHDSWLFFLPLHQVLKPRSDQSSEFIYLIVTA